MSLWKKMKNDKALDVNHRCPLSIAKCRVHKKLWFSFKQFVSDSPDLLEFSKFDSFLFALLREHIFFIHFKEPSLFWVLSQAASPTTATTKCSDWFCITKFFVYPTSTWSVLYLLPLSKIALSAFIFPLSLFRRAGNTFKIVTTYFVCFLLFVDLFRRKRKATSWVTLIIVGLHHKHTLRSANK